MRCVNCGTEVVDGLVLVCPGCHGNPISIGSSPYYRNSYPNSDTGLSKWLSSKLRTNDRAGWWDCGIFPTPKWVLRLFGLDK